MFHSFLSIAFYLTFGNSLSHASCWYLSSRKNGRRRRNQWFLLMPPFTTTSLTWLCKIYLAHYDSQKSLFHFLCHFLLSLILGERHFVIWNFSQAPVYLKKKKVNSVFLISFFSSFFTDLSRNKLTELPQECTDYYSLERLVLYHNSIRSIPDSIVYLQSLQFLDLSRNQLSYLPPTICELPLQGEYNHFTVK